MIRLAHLSDIHFGGEDAPERATEEKAAPAPKNKARTASNKKG